MTRQQRPVEPAPAVIRCAEDDCLAVTECEPEHAPRLTGRWRCRRHYSGTCAPTPKEIGGHGGARATEKKSDPAVNTFLCARPEPNPISEELR